MSTLQIQVIKTLVMNEVRLRSRRVSTLVVLILIALLARLIFGTGDGNLSMLVINQARTVYNSSSLALGTACLFSPLLGLLSFYLTRGRIAEDARCGIGAVIASTRIGNGTFIFSRWLGAVAYLLLILLAYLMTVIGLQIVRGEAAVQLMVYLKVYGLVLLPVIFFGVSCAILFDSVPLLMGKAGDVIYFFVWVYEISMLDRVGHDRVTSMPPIMILEGLGMTIVDLMVRTQFTVHSISIGLGTFNPSLPANVVELAEIPNTMLQYRAITTLLSLVPMLLAIPLFHRFSPDKIKLSNIRKRRSPFGMVNAWLRPVSRLAKPFFSFAAKMPNFAGQVVAEVAVTLVNAPLAIIAMIAFSIFAAFMNVKSLAGILVFASALWGVLISDLSTRDHQAQLSAMGDAVTGGADRRYLRQFAASVLLGFLLFGVVLYRWSFQAPHLALALLVGLLFMSALASMLGRFTRTSRAFLGPFMFWFYLAIQTKGVPYFDVLAFNESASNNSILLYSEIGIAALILGFSYNRYQAR
ncbi:hypothetical protein [Undibacterium flavidum]|uniref:ABC-2 type transport system permease protein n=1 Tax=Undibacterium flavidum TaxID=2762297 RepID=A0ABR6Y7U4_9BURK|nr:hypothetical protein [Undibacterium flavidum]MBC3872663.1 hypothetical protein [Undibacterium flavidum]